MDVPSHLPVRPGYRNMPVDTALHLRDQTLCTRVRLNFLCGLCVLCKWCFVNCCCPTSCVMSYKRGVANCHQ